MASWSTDDDEHELDDARDDDEGDGTDLDPEARADLEVRARAAGTKTFGLDVADLGMSDRAVIVERLGLPGGTAKELRRALSDPARLRATLLEVPPAALYVAEVLAEAGGRLTDATLTALVSARTGWSAPEVWSATTALAKTALVAVVERPYDRRRLVMLFDPSVEPLLGLVGGASVPDVAADTVQPRDPAAGVGRGWRDVIAVAALTAQRRVRATQDGRPDRGTVKTAGKDLGPSLAVFSELLDRAIDVGLVERAGDRFVPLTSALFRAARGEIDVRRADPDDPVSIVRRWLPEAEWVPLEGAARALWRAIGARRGWLSGPTWTDPARELARIHAALEESGEIEHGVAAPGDVPVIRALTAVPRGRGGDGHVTPSYEVLVGPGAELEVLIPIALGCELRKIDHVLTYRLGRESVAAGIAAGLDPAQLRDALARVGPHGIPPNVAATLDDWVAGVRTAALEHGLFLFGDPERIAALASGALAEHVVDRPVPGAIELEPATPEALLGAECARVGLTLPTRAVSVLHRSRRATSHDWIGPARSPFAPADPWIGSDPPLALRPAPDPEIRARLCEARPLAAENEPPPPSLVFRELVAALHTKGAVGPDGKALRALARLIQDAAPQLVVWMKRLEPDERRAATATIQTRFSELVPIVVLTPIARGPLLARAASIGALIEAAQVAACDPALRSSRGQAFLALTRPRAPRVAEPAAEGLGDAPATGPASRTVLDPNDVGAVLGAAIRSGRALRVRLADGETRDLVPERVLRRGPKTVVVGVDADRDQGVVIPLDTLVSVEELE